MDKGNLFSFQTNLIFFFQKNYFRLKLSFEAILLKRSIFIITYMSNFIKSIKKLVKLRFFGKDFY